VVEEEKVKLPPLCRLEVEEEAKDATDGRRA
jgi:hypothetical protein